jgi:ABC-type sulfate transport system substrate-binding protein
MRKFNSFIIGIFLAYFAHAQNFGGNPSSINWRQITTSHVNLIFPEGLDSQANRMANLIALLHENKFTRLGEKTKKMDDYFTKSNDHPKCLCSDGASDE